jgi:hypothetical protein
MPLTFNTFDSGVTTALVDRLRSYLGGLGAEYAGKVVEQTSPDVQSVPLVVVSPTELEEMVYQAAVYRVGLEITVKVDGKLEGGDVMFKNLSAAVVDCLQQEDLIAQLNAVKDETGRALCIVQGVVLEQSRLEDIGDWLLRRVYSLNVFGCAPLS